MLLVLTITPAAMGSQRVKRLFEIGFHRISIGWSNVENNVGSHCHPFRAGHLVNRV